MLSEEDMYFRQQLALCFKFCAGMVVIWQMMLYCYLKETHVVCLSSLFSIDNIFKLHPWQYGVFLNAAAITTWIDLCELGCIKGLLAMVYFCLFLWRKI
jgi:hypothetical protein